MTWMVSGIVILCILVFGSAGIYYGSKYVGKKIDQIQGKRWEQKLLTSANQAARDEEVAEAEKELEREMSRWR